jgi:hypothetical protein
MTILFFLHHSFLLVVVNYWTTDYQAATDMQSDPESSAMGSDCSSPVRSSGSPPKYNSTGFNRLTSSRGTGNHTTEFQGHFLIKRPTKWSNAAEQNLSALGGRSSDTVPEISVTNTYALYTF